MGNKWVHRLEWYEEDTLRGECSECGIVPVVKKKNYDRVVYRCSIAIKEQKGVRVKTYAYKTTDGKTVYLKAKDRFDLMNELGTTCNICGSEEVLRLDHCHESGKFRGVLCNQCNVGLGSFRDSPERMQLAINYLLTHRE
jgi:hypothetical protein